MTATKNLTIEVQDGDFLIKSGKGMTSFYFKNQEKLVFRTDELPKVIEMMKKCEEEWKEIK